MGLDIKKKWVHKIILQAQQTCHKDQPLQHLHIASQTGGPPWAPPVNNQNMEGCQKCDHHQYMPQDHQDLLECNGTSNGSTGVPGKSGKGPGPTKGKSKMSKPHPGTSLGTGSAGSSKNTIVCSACGESGH